MRNGVVLTRDPGTARPRMPKATERNGVMFVGTKGKVAVWRYDLKTWPDNLKTAADRPERDSPARSREPPHGLHQRRQHARPSTAPTSLSARARSPSATLATSPTSWAARSTGIPPKSNSSTIRMPTGSSPARCARPGICNDPISRQESICA